MEGVLSTGPTPSSFDCTTSGLEEIIYSECSVDLYSWGHWEFSSLVKVSRNPAFSAPKPPFCVPSLIPDREGLWCWLPLNWIESQIEGRALIRIFENTRWGVAQSHRTLFKETDKLWNFETLGSDIRYLLFTATPKPWYFLGKIYHLFVVYYIPTVHQ